MTSNSDKDMCQELNLDMTELKLKVSCPTQQRNLGNLGELPHGDGGCSMGKYTDHKHMTSTTSELIHLIDEYLIFKEFMCKSKIPYYNVNMYIYIYVYIYIFTIILYIKEGPPPNDLSKTVQYLHSHSIRRS